jgi:hypothetical protein
MYHHPLASCTFWNSFYLLNLKLKKYPKHRIQVVSHFCGGFFFGTFRYENMFHWHHQLLFKTMFTGSMLTCGEKFRLNLKANIHILSLLSKSPHLFYWGIIYIAWQVPQFYILKNNLSWKLDLRIVNNECTTTKKGYFVLIDWLLVHTSQEHQFFGFNTQFCDMLHLRKYLIPIT